MGDALWYDLDPDPMSRSRSRVSETDKIGYFSAIIERSRLKFYHGMHDMIIHHRSLLILDFGFSFQNIGQNGVGKSQNHVFLSYYQTDSDDILHGDEDAITHHRSVPDFRFGFRFSKYLTKWRKQLTKLTYASAIIKWIRMKVYRGMITHHRQYPILAPVTKLLDNMDLPT